MAWCEENACNEVRNYYTYSSDLLHDFPFI